MARSRRVHVARVYDPPGDDDGARVLVDRLWPRGLSKDAAALDHWCRDVAPSSELRKWYGHDPARFAEFAERYRAELDDPDRAAALAALRRLSREGPLTLLTATKDPDLSQARVLRRRPHRRLDAATTPTSHLISAVLSFQSAVGEVARRQRCGSQPCSIEPSSTRRHGGVVAAGPAEQPDLAVGLGLRPVMGPAQGLEVAQRRPAAVGDRIDVIVFEATDPSGSRTSEWRRTLAVGRQRKRREAHSTSVGRSMMARA